jgi:hypothetical protein
MCCTTPKRRSRRLRFRNWCTPRRKAIHSSPSASSPSSTRPGSSYADCTSRADLTFFLTIRHVFRLCLSVCLSVCLFSWLFSGSIMRRAAGSGTSKRSRVCSIRTTWSNSWHKTSASSPRRYLFLLQEDCNLLSILRLYADDGVQTLKLLEVASFFGGKFDVHTIAEYMSISVEVVENLLWHTMHQGTWPKRE